MKRIILSLAVAFAAITMSAKTLVACYIFTRNVNITIQRCVY